MLSININNSSPFYFIDLLIDLCFSFSFGLSSNELMGDRGKSKGLRVRDAFKSRNLYYLHTNG